MAKVRIVNTRFWEDTYVSKLDPTEKLLFLYFITNTHTNVSGIYELPLRIAAAETGIDKEMIENVVRRFSEDEKIYHINGWIFVKNFIKHQFLNESVVTGIKRALKDVPKEVMDEIERLNQAKQQPLFKTDLQPVPTLSPDCRIPIPILISKDKYNAPAKAGALEKRFSWGAYLQGMENHKTRHVQVVGFYFKEKGISFDTKEKANAAIKRHLRAAKEVANFTDEEIAKAADACKRDYPAWTIETLLKVLTR